MAFHLSLVFTSVSANTYNNVCFVEHLYAMTGMIWAGSRRSIFSWSVSHISSGADSSIAFPSGDIIPSLSSI
ncbi:hypothetical protein POJ06DRAFT_257702 [Lipomyces tetrasporus]|uniref:Uncharacterized protein n=1 Tax=Lipomyces tetrasporus TaxID=54092 RepID=A0AAD7QNK1_9ASCO|nr:uncharacterized protein POJ06DRAFT_257702 [Lipomyces tetrasporus]KAJ8098682.1 hypothetical protein POJ06DRAFT_257702 [Lipomyces tetrasporus]